MATETASSPGLKRHLTLRNGIGLIVGGIVGSGIFLTPNKVLELSGSVGAAIIVWVLAGLLSLCGALCYCELGTSIPETGGEHVYFKRAFGPLAAFLFTWSLILVVSPVSTALISLTFARYALKPMYSEVDISYEATEQRVAVAAIGKQPCSEATKQCQVTRVHKNKLSMQYHTFGSGAAKFQTTFMT